MSQPDLFYPNHAGWKETTTSKDAAEKIEKSGRAKSIRDRLLALFEAGERLTVYTAGYRLGVSQFAVRPRFSELSEQGKIRKMFQIEGEQGSSVWVWCKA